MPRATNRRRSRRRGPRGRDEQRVPGEGEPREQQDRGPRPPDIDWPENSKRESGVVRSDDQRRRSRIHSGDYENNTESSSPPLSSSPPAPPSSLSQQPEQPGTTFGQTGLIAAGVAGIAGIGLAAYSLS